ncbi:MAG: hypothetical protein HY689_02275 [Chloroflexi bacterium]|nr:hypothetical protein [Chloroflexota bacterium]
MEFIVRQLSSRPDTMLVRYDCACGCKPNAEYQQGSQEGGYEHCCCGNVHFLGPQAKAHLETYLADRKAQALDEDVGGYTVYETAVEAPWGGTVPVAYALPHHPKAH